MLAIHRRMNIFRILTTQFVVPSSEPPSMMRCSRSIHLVSELPGPPGRQEVFGNGASAFRAGCNDRDHALWMASGLCVSLIRITSQSMPVRGFGHRRELVSLIHRPAKTIMVPGRIVSNPRCFHPSVYFLILSNRRQSVDSLHIRFLDAQIFRRQSRG